MELKWTNQIGFKSFLHNKPLPDNWQELLFYAEGMINYCTMGRIRPDKLPSEVMDMVRDATYCQAHYYAETGVEMDMMSSGNIASFQLGQMAVSFKGHNNTGILNPQALRILHMTGLMYRGVK